MNNTLHKLLRQASQLTQSGRLAEATAAIQRLLHGRQPGAALTPSASPAAAPDVRDGGVIEVNTAGTAKLSQGEFISGSHSHQQLTRRYKLYVPPGHLGKTLPLVVMLHGCKQNPDDFAAGTGMNQCAQALGLFVLYPEQAADANPSACWNWFQHQHQQRGAGEPALIASLTQAITQQYNIDAQRVYVAGLSAGGAMAAVLAVAYPDIFAAVGVHSGLPAGAASNVAQALMVMKRGRTSDTPAISLPTIVFHGDADSTVHPHNGEQLVASARGRVPGQPQLEHGLSAQGQAYTRSIWPAQPGRAAVEYWQLHGAGHAWSGGRAEGSFTNPQGVDASAEMLRFFLSQRRGS
ncbi:PHB depolymerase family esterase [Rhodoferax sp. U11-2br]|uniref:extracellular catalytic domain type 1 short-chain-length polyhydroxyalkanoate depolymerase n=1 Tax=Rhodoferax sp. U11-2br TaxID=2838878 RepID=UPI001BEB2C0E|nr:PHB depolymerase family esterase [Rhodoferax sp. U11-2br]MBT3065324.1 PHB depolymerase family esterase [Rhodoferax sp. U11-2br]